LQSDFVAVTGSPMAERLHTLIHKVAWTTSTELFGELRIALQQMHGKNKPADADLASDIAAAIQILRSALSYRAGSRRFRVPPKGLTLRCS